MITALVILLSLWTLFVAFLLVAFYRFTRSPEFRWRQQVAARFIQLVAQRSAAEYTFDLLDADVEALSELKIAFARTSLQVSVEALARYPGIGPMTITRLREANFNTVADVVGVKLASVPNLARPQQSALHQALEKMQREALARVASMNNPEAMRLAAEIEQQTRGQQEQRLAAEKQEALAEAGLVAINMKLRLAEQIRFTNFLMGTRPAGLSDAVMAEPILAVAAPLQVATPISTPSGPPPATTTAPDMKSPAPPTELPSLTRFRVAARFGYAVAKADGRTAAGEKRQIRVFLERRYATAAYLITKLNQLIAEVEKDIPSLEVSLAEVRATIPKENWPELHQFALSIGDASGERNARKRDVNARVAAALEMTSAAPTPTPAPTPTVIPVSAPRSTTPPTDAECRQRLEIAPEVTLNADLLRRQYRLLSERYDPAKFAAHGADFVQLATRTRTAIEQAALQLLKPYNEPLEPPTPPPPADLRHNPDLDDFFGG